MRTIRLIHWNEAEAAERAALLESAGYRVVRSLPKAVRRETPPSAVVVDLSRMPSQGRDVAVAMRTYKPMCSVPFLFVGRSVQIRRLIPDATFTSWARIRADLRRALSRPTSARRIESRLAAYADVPVAKKLGADRVAMVGAPRGFRIPGVRADRGARLTLWFLESEAHLRREIRAMAPRAERGGLWIVWRKGGALTQQIVRTVGLANGLVDFKICRIDETWAALRFTHSRR